MKIYLFWLLCALQAVDVALTLAILRRGGTELNPLLSRLMRALRSPLAALLAVKVAVLALVAIFYAHVPLWLMAAFCAVMVAVCLHNWREFKK